MDREIIQKIKDADMVLVGIGEEFEEQRYLRAVDGYDSAFAYLKENQMEWAGPALKRALLQEDGQSLSMAFEALNNLIKEKNYFILTTVSNDMIWESSLNAERIVAPCGGSRWKQCPEGCPEGLTEITSYEWEVLKGQLLELKAASGEQKEPQNMQFDLGLGCCPACGKPYVLNNIYCEHYNENSYLPQWQLYTKWLQGTLNRKLCVLELGAGMRFPNIIRWPFEKAAYFNQKASFIRVNENLYQLSEELGEKGISVPQNAVDLLL